MKWPLRSGEDGCVHLEPFKRRQSDGECPTLDGFRKAIAFLRQRSSLHPLHCLECSAFSWLHICLHCVFIGCFAKDDSHIMQHKEKTGHFLSLETTYFQVYCGLCKDYIYDPEFHRILEEERTLAVERALPADPSRAPYRPWRPRSEEEAQLLASVDKWIDTSSSFGVGLRGLSNLGNTCFANCILQAFCHNPLLRNYFLTGLHQRELSRKHCPDASALPDGERVRVQQSDGAELLWGTVTRALEDNKFEIRLDSGGMHVFPASRIRMCDARFGCASELGECFACLTGSIFNELYSGTPKCFAPYRLLYAVWQHSEDLAGYLQQDAHEFFITLLDRLHMHCEPPVARDEASKDKCECIIHRVFTGGLQSDLTCTRCGAVSTTIEPFRDISVDIKPRDGPLSPSTPPSCESLRAASLSEAPPSFPATTAATDAAMVQGTSASAAGPDAADGVAGASEIEGLCSAAAQPATPFSSRRVYPTTPKTDASTITLTDCLKRFTRTEKLVGNEIFCKACNGKMPSTKKLSISRLPLVISIQLKRFERINDVLRKINTHIRFPEVLDMGPYLSSVPSVFAADSFQYTLFAVVNHSGDLQNGHYTCFVRLAQEGAGWFLCDDESISPVPLGSVLSSEGYMLFYVKTRIEYAA